MAFNCLRWLLINITNPTDVDGEDKLDAIFVRFRLVIHSSSYVPLVTPRKRKYVENCGANKILLYLKIYGVVEFYNSADVVKIQFKENLSPERLRDLVNK